MYKNSGLKTNSAPFCVSKELRNLEDEFFEASHLHWTFTTKAIKISPY